MKIVISGLGVMGASLAQALKNSNLNTDIWGYDNKEILDLAINTKIIDNRVDSWPGDCHDADLVFLATPIKIIKQHIAELNTVVSQNTIVTDIGSTKNELFSFCHKSCSHLQDVGYALS